MLIPLTNIYWLDQEKYIISGIKKSIIQSSFTALKAPCTPPSHPSPSPRIPGNHCSSLLSFFQKSYGWNAHYVAFSDWLILFSSMHLKFFQTSSCLDNSLLFIAESYSTVWITTVYSQFEGHWCYFLKIIFLLYMRFKRLIKCRNLLFPETKDIRKYTSW